MSRGRIASRRVTDQKKKRAYRFLKIIGVVSFILCIVFFAVGLVFSRPVFSVKDVKITGNQTLLSEDLENVIQKEFKHKRWGTYSYGSSVFFSHSHIKKILKQNFPRIESLDLTLEKSKLFLTVKERVSVYLACGARINNKCFFVDENGLVFARAPYFSGAVFFRWYPSEEPQIESSIVPFEKFTELVSLVESITERDLEIYGLEVFDSVYHLYLDNPHEREDTAYIEIKKDFKEEDIVDSLFRALATQDLEQRLEQGDTLMYIDMRFPSKVYYRFVGDE